MPSRRVTKPATYSGARGREEFNVRVRGMVYNTHTSTLSGVKKSNMKIPTIRATVRPYSARTGLLIGNCNPIPPSASGDTTALLGRACFAFDFCQLPVEGLPIDAQDMCGLILIAARLFENPDDVFLLYLVQRQDALSRFI